MLTPGRVIRRAAAVAVAALVASIISAPALVAAPAQAADAPTTDSTLTVAWNGDGSSAAQFQPERLPSSPHFGDFQNLSVTVSQTGDLIDQSIRVSVSGFTGTKSYNRLGVMITNAQNYVQAMQCWGDPASEDFRETCQWGARAQSGYGNIVTTDNLFRVNPAAMDPLATNVTDTIFRTPGGTEVTGRFTRVGAFDEYPFLTQVQAAITNEVTSARIGTDGTGFFDFETQSAIQAPQLGCGKDGQTRCWLVIVPRGSHFGGDSTCSSFRDPGVTYTYGRANSVQGGNPLSDTCDYWDNRIVVPLDFQPTAPSCPQGSKEVRVIGSQLMVGAMTSWQPDLCQNAGATFSFATNPDSVARAQILDNGEATPRVAFSGYPVSSGELMTEDERTKLSKATLAYAPVAVSSVVIGFLYEGANGRVEEMTLSPRLMAKILTQSYRFSVPVTTDESSRPYAHLAAANQQYRFLNEDPEFQALNPNYAQISGNPSVILPGPSGADAITQVWRWILADADAVSFLDGNPDPMSGMTVNPYYLPKGHPLATIPWFLDANGNDVGPVPGTRDVGLINLDGSPRNLSQTVLDSFPKGDETVVPLTMTQGMRQRMGSLQFTPYADNLLMGARWAFRAQSSARTVWDPLRVNGAGEVGDWVSPGAQLPGARFLLTITDSPSAARYSLSTASLQLPNSAEAVAPTAGAMVAALGALTPTSLNTVTQVNPAAVQSGAYPLTMVTYAAVNVSASTAEARGVTANMLARVSTTGQTAGTSSGELPPGYVPLTADLQAQTAAAVAAIRAFGTTPPPVKSSTTTSTNKPSAPSNSTAQNDSEGQRTAAMTTDEGEIRTSATLASSALAIALVIGFVGFLFGPLLFRGFR